MVSRYFLKNRKNLKEKTVADYIDFYNCKRPHRKLKMQTPDQFERSWFEKDVTAGN